MRSYLEFCKETAAGGYTSAELALGAYASLCSSRNIAKIRKSRKE
jgi:hypothetical protein